MIQCQSINSSRYHYKPQDGSFDREDFWPLRFRHYFDCTIDMYHYYRYLEANTYKDANCVFVRTGYCPGKGCISANLNQKERCAMVRVGYSFPVARQFFLLLVPR